MATLLVLFVGKYYNYQGVQDYELKTMGCKRGNLQ